MVIQIGYAGLALLFVLPFLPFVHSEPIPSFFHEWLAALCGLTACMLLLSRWVRRGIPVPLVSVIPLFLLLLIAWQTASGVVLYKSQAVLACLSLGLALLLLPATKLLLEQVTREQLVRNLAIALVVAGAFNAIAGLVQVAGLEQAYNVWVSPRVEESVYGNLAQRNQFTVLTMLALLSVLYLNYVGFLRSWRFVPLAILFVVALAISGSRSSWLYLFAALVFAFLLWRRTASWESRRLVYLLLAVFPLFFLLQALFALEWAGALHKIVTANERLTAEGAGVSDSRLEVWRHAWMMFVESGWQGVGFRNFAWNHFQLLAERYDQIDINSSLHDVPFDNAHNLVFHLLAEFGIWGALALLGAMVWLLFVARRVDSGPSWWAWSLIATLGIHSLLEFPLWYLQFLLPFVVLLAILEGRSFNLSGGSLLRPILSVVLAVGLLILGELYLENSALTRVFAVQRVGGGQSLPRNDVSLAMRSGVLAPYTDRFLSRLPVAYDSPRLLKEQRIVDERFVRFFPEARTLLRSVLLRYLVGDGQGAEEYLVRTVRAYPHALKDFSEYLKGKLEEQPELRPLLNSVERHREIIAERRAGDRGG